MGLANLLPGISGGTMLLATGVYPAFIAALASATRLRLRGDALLLLVCVTLGAAAAVLALAAPVRALLLAHRWPMHSLFIGLTLGGAPLVWRRVPRHGPALFAAAALAFGAMLWLLLLTPAAATRATADAPLLFLAGLAGASAMILPGVSGATLLLLLGQYLPVLTGLAQFTRALSGAGAPAFADALRVLAPTALGAAVGLLALSRLLHHALARWPQLTHGALLGLLAGAIAPLWPFRTTVSTATMTGVTGGAAGVAGTAAVTGGAGVTGTAGSTGVAGVAYNPGFAELAGALALIAVGFALTRLLDHLAKRLGARD